MLTKWTTSIFQARSKKQFGFLLNEKVGKAHLTHLNLSIMQFSRIRTQCALGTGLITAAILLLTTTYFFPIDLDYIFLGWMAGHLPGYYCKPIQRLFIKK